MLKLYQSFSGFAEEAVLILLNLSCRFFSCCSKAFSFSSASCLVSLDGWGLGWSFFSSSLVSVFLFLFIFFWFLSLLYFLFAVPAFVAAMLFEDSAGHLHPADSASTHFYMHQYIQVIFYYSAILLLCYKMLLTLSVI